MTNDERDALRFRWLARQLKIASDGAGEWTCWLELDCIPVRWSPEKHDATELLDALIARFPMPAADERPQADGTGTFASAAATLRREGNP